MILSSGPISSAPISSLPNLTVAVVAPPVSPAREGGGGSVMLKMEKGDMQRALKLKEDDEIVAIMAVLIPIIERDRGAHK